MTPPHPSVVEHPPTSRTAVRSPIPTDQIRGRYARPGAWLTLHLDGAGVAEAVETTTSGSGGPSALDTLLTTVRGDGAPPGLVDQVRQAVVTSGAEDGMLSVLARVGEQPCVGLGPEPPRADVAHVGDLPYALPLLEVDQAAHVHAVADLRAVGDGLARLVVFERDASTRSFELVSGSATGLGRAVAARLPTTCELTVVIAPDGQCPDVVDHLDSESAGRVITLAPGPEDHLADEIVRQLATLTAEETVESLQRYRAAAGEALAVEGPAPVVSALRAGAVRALLVHDDPADQRRAWFDEAPTEVFLHRGDAPDERARFESRWGDVLARSAVLQDAEIRVVPSTGPAGPSGAVGAVLDRPAADLELPAASPTR